MRNGKIIDKQNGEVVCEFMLSDTSVEKNVQALSLLVAMEIVQNSYDIKKTFEILMLYYAKDLIQMLNNFDKNYYVESDQVLEKLSTDEPLTVNDLLNHAN